MRNYFSIHIFNVKGSRVADSCPDQKPDPSAFQLQKIKMAFMNAYHFGNYLLTLFRVHFPLKSDNQAFKQVGL